MRELALDEQRAVAPDGERGDHARGAEAADLDRHVDLVVEARGRLVARRRLDDLEVDAVGHHPRVAAGRLAPELGQRDVEVGEVVGVEDDALGVALAVADAQSVGVRAAHGGDPSDLLRTTFQSAAEPCGVAGGPCKNPCREPFPSDPPP